MKLFGGNLSYEITSADLQTFFGQVGRVISARVIADGATGQSKGFGFVEMSNRSEAETAIQEFNGVKAIGRTLVVSPVRAK